MAFSWDPQNTVDLFAGIATPHRFGGLVDLPPHEWQALSVHRPNVLIQGDESFVESTLVALKQDFLPNAGEWSQISSLSTFRGGAIIVRNVGGLADPDRLKLMAWLEQAHPHVQVISTTTTPLYALVERGDFPADLYYRLDAVTLNAAIVGARRSDSSRAES